MTWQQQHEPRFEAICECIERHGEGLHVLDVGAEPFDLTNRILGLDAVDRVTGITLDRDGIADCVELPNGCVPIVTCNVERDVWPVKPEHDVVVMGAILEHLFEPAFALHQARMSVKHGGRLVLSTPNGVSLKTRVETAQGIPPTDAFAHPENGTRYDRHQHEYTKDELRDLLACVSWYPADIESIQLARDGGRGRVYQSLASVWDTLGDQWIVSAHAGPKRGQIQNPVYRDSLVTRRE